ncbi:SCO family protein [Marinobacter halodurans]|uniref:SCO family protein n=1 Tax=Marinobacter halodurans TaxID=2528979 RepID=A0ABY1ZJK0_9GAMM|nr:SCO family protein [Marinobacter halodurans]TBW53322.1 SCO family protein [Marinobacter halodurans]
MLTRVVLPLLITIFLAGCSGENWRTTDISTIMPPLDFKLVNEDGRTVTEEDYEKDGKATLLFFGYTHCPDVCPTTLARLAKVTNALDKDLRDKLQVLFVSVDPARDTPEAMATYTSAFGPEFIGMTGDKAELDEITNRYRIAYSYDEPDKDGNYTVTHSSAVLAFDSQGKPAFMVLQSDPDVALKGDLTRLIEKGQG